MSVLIRYAPSSLTRAQYDAVNQAIQASGEPPPPELELHVLFGDDGDMRVSEIWASEDAWRQEYDGPLKQALADAGVDMPNPEVMPVHELWGSKAVAD